MKMVRNLLILLGAVAVALAAVLLLPRLAPQEEPIPTLAPTTPPEHLQLSNKRAADVSRITIDNEDGRMVYYWDADEELWKLEGHEDIEIDQSKAKDVAYTASYISGESVIMDDLSNLAEYGLDKPAITVETEFLDGTSIRFYIGNPSPSRQTNYAYMEGGTRVVDLWMNYARNFRYKLEDLISVNMLEMSIDNIVKVRLERSGREPLEVIDRKGTEHASLFSWYVAEPWEHLCDTEKINKFLQDIVAIEPAAVASSNPGNLADYGLDEPSMTLYVENSDGGSYTLYVGDAADSSNTYVALEGDPMVYKIGTNKLKAIDVNPFAITDKLLSLIFVSNVDEMHFSGLGDRFDVQIRQVERKDEKGETKLDANGKPITDSEYTMDGKPINASAGSQLYQACLGVRLHSPLSEEFTPAGAPAATLTYDLKLTGIKRYEFKFYDYKKDYYAVSINGEINFIVLKEEVQNIVTVLGQVRSGELDN
ncbi:MAG: DUF4340 domain-containing protein [Christensenellales bacterium]|jgi:hypothetical protein